MQRAPQACIKKRRKEYMKEKGLGQNLFKK